MNDITNAFDWNNLITNSGIDKNTQQQKGLQNDPRAWKLSKGVNGNGVALIRILPYIATDAEGKRYPIPFIEYKSFFAKRIVGDKAKYFIANSPASIGGDCPGMEAYKLLMQRGQKEEAQKYFKYSKKYIANVLIIKDPANPKNDGRIALWEFGPGILTKLSSWASPSDEEKTLGVVARNPFSPIDGYSVAIKAVKPENGIVNYNNSTIADAPSLAIQGIDTYEKYIEFSDKNLFDLGEFKKPDFYHTYDEIKTKIDFFYPGLLSEGGGDDNNSANNIPTTVATTPPDWNEVPAENNETMTAVVEDESNNKTPTKNDDDTDISWL